MDARQALSEKRDRRGDRGQLGQQRQQRFQHERGIGRVMMPLLLCLGDDSPHTFILAHLGPVTEVIGVLAGRV